ncbi:hypothetical protein TREES_T100000723 [Tupaia chinensis]|uniref:Uncharacterized protein n=1 Tax=Tupaia chinensis TaxID=246437 RepID=L9KK60_TUPCH|nr:hypothetical protein TREES_T100000723 [Tupaia chinensis]
MPLKTISVRNMHEDLCASVEKNFTAIHHLLSVFLEFKATIPTWGSEPTASHVASSTAAEYAVDPVSVSHSVKTAQSISRWVRVRRPMRHIRVQALCPQPSPGILTTDHDNTSAFQNKERWQYPPLFP